MDMDSLNQSGKTCPDCSLSEPGVKSEPAHSEVGAVNSKQIFSQHISRTNSWTGMAFLTNQKATTKPLILFISNQTFKIQLPLYESIQEKKRKLNWGEITSSFQTISLRDGGRKIELNS